MIKLTWHEEKVPEGMQIRQVYAVAFAEDGRVILKIKNTEDGKSYSLAGGTPESFDKDNEATLRREYVEEINTTLQSKVCYLGYVLVEGDGDRAPYAQVRTTALIDKIGPRQPDPDGGEIYERVLVCPQKAIKLLNWGDIGRFIITKAVEVARAELGIEAYLDKDEYV